MIEEKKKKKEWTKYVIIFFKKVNTKQQWSNVRITLLSIRGVFVWEGGEGTERRERTEMEKEKIEVS